MIHCPLHYSLDFLASRGIVRDKEGQKIVYNAAGINQMNIFFHSLYVKTARLTNPKKIFAINVTW